MLLYICVCFFALKFLGGVQLARHITQLKINGYRSLRNFEINDLADINILLGDNNCGKTSVLEVLNTFSAINQTTKWLNTNITRRSIRGNLNPCYDLECLFDINNTENEIEISFKDSKNQINNVIFSYSSSPESLMMRDIKGIDKLSYRRLYNNIRYKNIGDSISQDTKQEIDDIIINAIHSYTRIKINDTKPFEDNFYDFSPVIMGGGDKISFFNTIFHYPYKYIREEINLSDIIENKKLYNDLISVLQQFDKEITQIFADQESDKVIYKIASSSNNKSLPISIFGDGLKLAISVFADIPRAQNGLLLIDEFDSSLHTSQISKILSAMIIMCKKFNIQLFLTTHNKEAIDKILECCKDFLNDVRIISMTKNEKRTYSQILDGQLAWKLRFQNDAELR